MSGRPGEPTARSRYDRLPVRWWWPALAAGALGAAASWIFPAVAFGTSYCPPDGPDPADVRFLRIAVALAWGVPAVPFVAASATDAWRGARRAAGGKLAVAAFLLGTGLVAAAGAAPSTWCF